MLKRFLTISAALLIVSAVVLWILFERANLEHAVLNDEVRADAPGDFVRLSDGMTHYQLGGAADGEPVVLVHGFSVPFYIWDPTFAALTDGGFRVLRYDLYGRGYSDRPDTVYDSALFERQLDELIEAVGLNRPVSLVGLSMGGAIVMHYAADRPGAVRRLVLLDPVHDAYSTPRFPEPVGHYLMALNYLPGMAQGQLGDFLYPDNYPDWVSRYEVQMQYDGFRRAIVSTIYHFMGEDHAAAFRRVGEHNIPVKLIWGLQDQTVPVSGAEHVQSLLAVDYLPVDQSGHLPHIEQPAVVNEALAAFLRAPAENSSE